MTPITKKIADQSLLESTFTGVIAALAMPAILIDSATQKVIKTCGFEKIKEYEISRFCASTTLSAVVLRSLDLAYTAPVVAGISFFLERASLKKGLNNRNLDWITPLLTGSISIWTSGMCAQLINPESEMAQEDWITTLAKVAFLVGSGMIGSFLGNKTYKPEL